MQKRDSLLQLLVKWNLHETYPALAERLATEDITLPDLRRTVQFLEMRHAIETALRPGERLRFKCKGLTATESGIALSQCAIGGHVGDHKSEPQMAGWIEEMCRAGQIPRPRLIILDSDEPLAAALCDPGEKPRIFITSNLREILNERQLRAVIGHELRHVKERANNGNLVQLLKRGEAMLTTNESAIREEYRADAFSTQLGNAPDDLVDGLLAIRGRFAELQRFGNQAADVVAECLEPRVINDLRLAALLSTAGRFPPVQETDWATRRRNNQRDEHPPLMSRFARLFDSDVEPPKPSRR